ncbi:hypothetical protein BMT54_08975 [Pasteurellaceae bacterium 15-036681]|nr:hypothetical protein BMT54_08975 [Pasteurellaceae bacterium 15-036681]
MKTFKLLALTSLLTISSVASAGFNDNTNQKGGFVGTNQTASITTIAQALKAADNAQVQITGKIQRQVKDDEFIFRDETGEILIDVDDDAWQGQNITQNDTITIYGKVDEESFKANEIEVYRVQKH